MALEDILRALEEKAEVRIEAVQSDAQQRVAEITSEVERDSDRTRRARLKKVEDAVRSEATAIVYSAQLKAKNELIKAQEETVEAAFRLAEQKLNELSKENRYPKILEVLLSEALEYFGGGEVLILIRPEDRSLVENLMSERKQPYGISDTPLESSGGLIVSSPGGKVVVSNTFESRLGRARDKLRLAISKTLFAARSEN